MRNKTSNFVLPDAIQAYFAADQISAAAAPVAAFAADAIVQDEGKTHIGHEAIAAWWRMAKAHYEHRATPREVSHHGERVLVRAEVSGRFPGSPALLSFTFTLEDDRIAALVIGA